MSIGPFEILLVLSFLLLIIGPRRVTNMARSLGRGVQDFFTELSEKKAVSGKRSTIGEGDDEDDAEDEGQKSSKTLDEQ